MQDDTDCALIADFEKTKAELAQEESDCAGGGAVIREKCFDLSTTLGHLDLAVQMATRSGRFSTLHCFEFDTSKSLEPLFQKMDHTSFSEPWIDNFGNSVRCRIKSFLRGSLCDGRSSYPLEPGEIREISVLTYPNDKGVPPSGSLNVLVSFGAPGHDYKPFFQDQNHLLFGLNVIPLVLVGTRPSSKRTSIFTRLDSYAICSSVCRVRRVAEVCTTIELRRGFHTHTVAEYLKGKRRNLTSFDMKQVFELDHSEFKKTRQKCEKKLMQTFFDDNPNVEDVDIHVNMLMETSQHVAETSTIAALLDLCATGTFNGILTSYLESPMCSPLYISTAVILAGCPALMNHSQTASKCEASRRVMDIFLNLVPAFESSHNSCIELACWCALEQMRDENGHLQMHQCHSIDHITRQGQALCLELTNNAQKNNIDNFRMSTRESRLRCLLRVMISTNNWLRSGHWRGKPFSPENFADDAAKNDYNRSAMLTATSHLTQILSYGVYAQALKGPAVSIPIISHCVTSECRQCGRQFETASLMKRTKALFGCSNCEAVFCNECVRVAVDRTRTVCDVEKDAAFPITALVVEATTDVWWCGKCIRSYRKEGGGSGAAAAEGATEGAAPKEGGS